MDEHRIEPEIVRTQSGSLTGESLLPFLRERKELNDKFLRHFLMERRRSRMPREDLEMYAIGMLHARLGDDLLLAAVEAQVAGSDPGAVLDLSVQVRPEDINAATQQAVDLITEIYTH